jgi:two-component system response regulator GlrR
MKGPSRILIVDDDPEIARMLSKSLARHGYEIDTAASAEEALAQVEARPADAALVDLVMPGRDGADLAELLRRKLPGLPIGILTGYRNSPLLPADERSGIKVFKKPLIIQELVDFLKAEIR